ncbi:MAG: DUF427 domain-containing protein, partial [Actinomycetota bacterium]|nr:DUF427 domain-containing protein [Actinomycetota bacterium]
MQPKPQEPGPGQESVWAYPRPPASVPADRHIVVRFGGRVIADSVRAVKVMETSHPPVYYLPPDDVSLELLEPSPHRTFCEFKGEARYYTARVGDAVAHNAGWYYPHPSPGYEILADHIAFYPALMDECTVDGEVVKPQPGRFYGGWVTSDV